VLNDFFSWCAGTTSCRWRPLGDPTTAWWGSSTDRRRSRSRWRRGSAGPGEFYDALLDNLYSRSSWPTLGDE